jgi:hypothetical protein
VDDDEAEREMIGSKSVIALLGAALGSAACGADEARPANQPQQNLPETAAPPPQFQEQVDAVHGRGLIPPGAVIGSDSPTGDAVSITFQSREPPERVAAWYRSPDRAADFRLGSELREGAEQVLGGSTLRPPGEFNVRIAPGISGGTTATILITEP